MSEHTPGLLALEEVASDSGHIKHLCPVDSEGMSLLTVVEHEGVKFAAVYSDDDARRFMACWNACEGLHTESLERGPSLADQLVDVLNERDSLRAVNAELIKALERSADALDRLTDKVDGTGFSSSDEFNNALDEIDLGRAAIASARKQENQHG